MGDREGMAFSGTLVSSGRGTGVVVATGSDTELGRINQLMAAVSALDTPLLRQIKKFGYAITAVIAVVSVIVFAYGRWVRRAWISSPSFRRSSASPCRLSRRACRR